MRTIFFLAILAFAAAVPAQNSGGISGQATPYQYSLSDVVVLKKGNDVIATTHLDSRRRFRFENVAAGDYVVETHANPGCTGSEAVSVAAGAVSEVSIGLGHCSVYFPLAIVERVTVAAERPQRIEEVSKTVDEIGGQEMRDRADITLVDSLRTMPGMRIQQLGGPGRTASIKTRGLRNQDTAILIDGIRFRDASAISGDATAFLGDITLTSVREVEVLRGSGSSLYGTNAIGGVVSFNTPAARRGTHGQIGGAIGGLGMSRFRGNLSHGLASGRAGFGGGYSQTVHTKGIDGQDNARNSNLQLRADGLARDRTKLSGRIFFSDAKVRLNVNPDTFGMLPAFAVPIIAEAGVNFIPDENDPDAFQRSRFFNGQLSGEHFFGDTLQVSAFYQGSHTRRRNDDGPLGPGWQSAYGSMFKGRIDTLNAKFSWTPVRANTLVAGYEFEREGFANEGLDGAGATSFRTSADQSSDSFFVQDLLNLLNGDLQLAGSFRMQRFGLGRTDCGGACPAAVAATRRPPSAYTGDAAASYFVRKTLTKLRAHVGNGYRVPSLYERFGSYYFFGAFYPLGNPLLKPERSTGVDAGIDQWFDRGKVQLSATYFYTEIRDEISYLPTTDLTRRPTTISTSTSRAGWRRVPDSNCRSARTFSHPTRSRGASCAAVHVPDL